MERTDCNRKSAKRKPPVIRQTLTSMFRIAKTNPLLFIEDAAIIKNSAVNELNVAKLPNSLKPLTKPMTKNINIETETKPKVNVKPKTDFQPKFSIKQPTKTLEKKPIGSTTSSRKEVPKVRFVDPIRRRSRSADNYDHRFAGSSRQFSTASSLTNIPKDELKNISSIAQERKVKFQTPVRTVEELSDTPFRPPIIKQHSTPYSFTNRDHHLQDLQERLKQWLRKRKISSENFRHLKCFGLHKENVKDEENKENVEIEPINTSYEDLRIETPIAVHTKPEDLRSIVQGCLDDLHRLILEGYCLEQIEAWLNIIRAKYCFLENEPQYWECRAAIEQNRNNLTSAVECFRKAIVQGAEVNSIDRSLEKLLQKFSLLNINTPKDSNVESDRARIVKDARNVFKSSIIQFAIQERTMKKKGMDLENGKKFKATPVRRSTRLTPSRYRNTPKLQICSSLHDLDDSVRSNIDFQGNSLLSVRFSGVAQID